MTYVPPDDPHSPVRCRYCGAPYDLGRVTPTARYADCTMYVTPCCGQTADDRPWVSLPAFDRLTTAAYQALVVGAALVDQWGVVTPGWRRR